jgi:hypothetical protein
MQTGSLWQYYHPRTAGEYLHAAKIRNYIIFYEEILNMFYSFVSASTLILVSNFSFAHLSALKLKHFFCSFLAPYSDSIWPSKYFMSQVSLYLTFETLKQVLSQFIRYVVLTGCQ